MVLVKDQELFQRNWPLAVVERVHARKDLELLPFVLQRDFIRDQSAIESEITTSTP